MTTKTLDQRVQPPVGAPGVTLFGFDPTTDHFAVFKGTDNGDGTISLALSGTISLNPAVEQGTIPWKSKDDYQGGEVLTDQIGAAGVLTFTFSSPVQMVVMESVGENLVSRADPFGGTPTASLGIRLDDTATMYVPVETSAVKVFAPSGATVSVYGLRRA